MAFASPHLGGPGRAVPESRRNRRLPAPTTICASAGGREGVLGAGRLCAGQSDDGRPRPDPGADPSRSAVAPAQRYAGTAPLLSNAAAIMPARRCLTASNATCPSAAATGGGRPSDREAVRNGHRLYGKPVSSKVRPVTSGNPAFSARPIDGSGWRNVKSIALGALWPPRLSAQWPENTAFPQDGQTAQLRGHWAL